MIISAVIKALLLLCCWLTTLVSCGEQHRLTRSLRHRPIDCARTKSLSPCRCHNWADDHDRGRIYAINCTEVYSDLIDLKILSQRLSDELFTDEEISEEHAGYAIEKLVIHNSAVRHIRSDVFPHEGSKTISFVEIEIMDNKMLEFIDRNAFDGSSDTLRSLKITKNDKLYSIERLGQEIWDFVHKFRNLEVLKISHISLSQIPSYAFRPDDGNFGHLRHIELSHNKIHSIEDYAFEGLTAPSLKLWLNNNKISTIAKNTFKFKNLPQSIILQIDLSKNLLTADSFDPLSFTAMGRPLATLILRDNQIETLHQQVFLPLFDRSDKNYFQLEIDSKQLKCQCSLQWAYKTKYCYDEHKIGSMADQIKDVKCRSSDFASCKSLSEQLSPSCLKGNNNSAFNSSLNNCLILFNISIVLTLIYDKFYPKYS